MGERFDPNSAGYQVGYGKPPPKHQWQPGQSGNPQGRPRRPVPTSSEIGLAFGDALLTGFSGTVRVKTAIGVEYRPFWYLAVEQLKLDFLKGTPAVRARLLKLFLNDLGYLQADYVREAALRKADERVAEIQRLSKIDAILEFMHEHDRPRTDEEWIEHLGQIKLLLTERARMRSEGMSDDEIYAAEAAGDDDDHPSLDDANQEESDDPIFDPPQIKMVEPKPASPPDQPGEDPHCDAPGHDPDPPPRR